MKIQRVALYIRVSTQEQATEGYWVESQMRLLRSYVDAQRDQGWQLSEKHIFKDEWLSGASTVEERPALTQVKKGIINGDFDILLVYKLDRLFRKTSYLLEFCDFLREYKVNLVSKNESIDMQSTSGALVVTMLAAIGEMEMGIIRERTMEGKINKTLEGYYVQWPTPYGYRKEFDGRGQKLVIDEEEAKTVRRMFDLYLNENMTTNAIRNYLNGLWGGTRYDKEGSKQKISENFIHYSFVQRILSNEIYTGKCYTRKRETKKIDGKKKQVYRDKKDWLCVKCPAIIDENTFEMTQEKLSKGKVIHGRGELHIFTGLVKCGICGKSYNYRRSSKGTGNYCCGGKNPTKVSELCINPSISEEKLLDFVWRKVSAIFNHPEEFAKVYLAKTEDQSKLINEYQLEILDIDEKLQKNERILMNALKKPLEDEPHAQAYEKIILETDQQKIILEKRKAELQEKLKNMKSLKELEDTFYKLAKMYQEDYKAISLENKITYIRSVVEKIELLQDTIKVVYSFNI